MRRALLGGIVFTVGVAGVFFYNGLMKEREFQRLTTNGDLAVTSNQGFLAIEAYSGALALEPNSMATYLKRGELYQRQGDLKAAKRDLTRAAYLDPTATRPHERLGDLAIALNSYDEAIRHYSDFVRLDSRSTQVLYKLALVNQRSGRVANGVLLLRQAIGIDNQFIEAYHLLGISLIEQGRLQEAREVLKESVRLSPSFLKSREALADVYKSLGDENAELQHLDALAALDRTNPKRHVARALAYARAGQTDLAVLTLGRAAEEHPEQPQVYEALGRVWFKIAESQNDQVALRKALEAWSSVPTTTASSSTLVLLGRARLLDGDTEGAKRAMRLAINQFPVSPEAYLQLAELEEIALEWEEANLLRRQYRALTSPPSISPTTAGIPQGN